MLLAKLLFFTWIMCFINAYRILVIFTFPVRSLNLLGEGYVRHLLEAGNEVTYISVYPVKNPHKNLTHIDASELRDLFADLEYLNIGHVIDSLKDESTDILFYQEVGLLAVRRSLAIKAVQELLNDSTQHFDAVISDLFETEVYAGFSAIYNCPMIWAYSMGAHSIALRLVSEPANPAYAVDYLTTNNPPFSFLERVDQLWSQIKWHYYIREFIRVIYTADRLNGPIQIYLGYIKLYTSNKFIAKRGYVKGIRFYTGPQEEELYNDFFRPYAEKRGRILPDYQELIFNASLILSNEHLVGNSVDTPQNFKFIGGFHIDETVEPLPKDLQSLLDSAKHGVIYFSMGSTWKSKDIPQPLKEGLLKMFGQLKETVIWKYEETDLKNVPKNLHIVDWAPQKSILAHPNCLLFITHGGHLSSTEALSFGVPIIGVPIHFDQIMNINRAVHEGYALSAKLDTNLPTNLKLVIDEMVNNQKYKHRAQELALIFHDRPVHPGKELAHWVHHAIKTKGAQHLRSPARLTPFYQKMYLDLLAIVLAVILTIVYVTIRLIKLVAKKPYPKHTKKALLYIH